MKNLLWTVALAVSAFLLPLRASAAGLGNIQPAFVYQTGVSSITTTIASVSTSAITGATQMDNPQMANRVVIEIQNIDASANLWCVPVSTTPTVNNARKIAAGNSWVVSTLDTYYTTSWSSSTTPNITNNTGSAKFWCLSDGAAATKAAVTQMY